MNLLQQSVNILQQLKQNTKNNGSVPFEIANKLHQLAKEISSLNKPKKQIIDYSKDHQVQSKLKRSQCETIQTKGVFIHFAKQIISFLDLADLLKLRGLNGAFKDEIEFQLRDRISQEEQLLVTQVFSQSQLCELKVFLLAQLPSEEWMVFDYKEAKQITSHFQREVESMKRLRTVSAEWDMPFQIIVALYGSLGGFDSFRKLSLKTRIQEQGAIRAIQLLNNVDWEKAQKQGTLSALYYSQGAISMYLLENIFRVRNAYDSELTNLVELFRQRMNKLNFARKILKIEGKFVISFNFEQNFGDVLLLLLPYFDSHTQLKLRVDKSTKDAVMKILRCDAINSIYNFEREKLNYQLQGPAAEIGFFSAAIQTAYTLINTLEKQVKLKTGSPLAHLLHFAYRQVLYKDIISPFSRSKEQIDQCNTALQDTCTLAHEQGLQNEFEEAYSFFLVLYLVVLINHATNPGDEVILKQLYLRCQSKLSLLHRLKWLSSVNLSKIIVDAYAMMDESCRKELNFRINPIFDQLDSDKPIDLATDLISTYESLYVRREFQFDQFERLFEKQILCYLNYQDLVIFAQCSSLSRNIYWGHLKIRIESETEALKRFEKDNKQQLKAILNKRQKHSKEEAFQLMHSFSQGDLHFLQHVEPNPWYDYFAQPLVLLLDPEYNNTSYWQQLGNIISFDVIEDIAPEVLPRERIRQIQRLLLQYDLAQLYKLNQAFYRLIQWLQGVIYLHRYLRQYSIGINDKVTEEERAMLTVLDERQALIYRGVRYLNLINNKWN